MAHSNSTSSSGQAAAVRSEAIGTASPGDSPSDIRSDGDGGPACSENRDIRKCLASGENRAKAALVRFVVGPDNGLYPDIAENLPGRGLWVSADRASINQAVRDRKFSRAARQQVDVAPDIADRVEGLLAKRAMDLLGLARRSGSVIAGFEKVRAQLKGGKAAVLIAAGDASADGRRKLRALAGELPLIELFSNSELSLALGRENVVHAALVSGRLTGHFLKECDRLAGFRVSEPEKQEPVKAADKR